MVEETQEKVDEMLRNQQIDPEDIKAEQRNELASEIGGDDQTDDSEDGDAEEPQ